MDAPKHIESLAMPASVVYVVDDDPAVRKSISFLLGLLEIEIRALDSAMEFVSSYRKGVPSCLVLDVRMPGISGLELQERLNQSQIDIPIIFISGHGDIPMAVRAMRAGAVDFLTKPFNDQDLLDRVQRALNTDRQRQLIRREKAAVAARHALLTQREAEILKLVIAGHTNKDIATMLSISVKTVETHRARLMEKMRVDNVAELCQAHQLLQS
jgi:two-component system, LuxR family, response regulator FixJ